MKEEILDGILGGSPFLMCGCIFLIVFLMIGFGITHWFVTTQMCETVSDKVIKTERVTTQSSSKYLIYGDKETYENTDSWLNGKTNSSDIYGKLTANNTYEMKVCGFRNSFFSLYRNIITIKEINK